MRARPVVLLVAALAACGSSASREVTTAPTTTAPTTTSSTSTTTTTTEPSPAAHATATATESGIEIALTVEHAAVDAGTRLWADLVITNVGDTDVFWQAGGCGTPGGITLLPPGGATEPDPARGWDGEAATFADWVTEHDAVDPTIRFVEAAAVDATSHACPANSVMKALGPGEQLHQRAAADIRLLPDAPGGTFTATGAFRSYAAPGDYGYQETDHPRPVAIASVPIEVRPHPGGADDAIAAFADTDELGDFVDSTRTSSVANTWTTALSWWDGAWELLVTPYFSDGPLSALQLRFDPERGEIVDARVVPI